MAELVKTAREVAKKYAIADKDARVATADVLRTKLLGVIDERGAAEEMKSAAGGKTGLMVRQLKRIGQGSNAQVVRKSAPFVHVYRVVMLRQGVVDIPGPSRLGTV